MFYSRPKIEPLGWDLIDWPVPNGPKHHDGITSDNRPVDFWFSGGWLTVSRGPVGAAAETPDMEEIFSTRIAPFGTLDIEPAQICEMCGITVQGRKVEAADRSHLGYFDWSGRTTYWQSEHMLLDGDDAREFVDILLRAFHGSILIQPQWGSGGRARCRRVKFLLSSDDIVHLGVNWSRNRLEALTSGKEVSGELLGRVFDYSLTFRRADHWYSEPTGSRFVHENGGKDLDYSVAHHRRYRITTGYRTGVRDDEERTRKLISVIDGYFLRGLKMVNLETGAVIAENAPDDTDEKSYSRQVRETCLREEKRYVYVSKSLPENPLTLGESVFYGLRPTAL